MGALPGSQVPRKLPSPEMTAFPSLCGGAEEACVCGRRWSDVDKLHCPVRTLAGELPPPPPRPRRRALLPLPAPAQQGPHHHCRITAVPSGGRAGTLECLGTGRGGGGTRRLRATQVLCREGGGCAAECVPIPCRPALVFAAGWSAGPRGSVLHPDHSFRLPVRPGGAG